MADTLGRYTIRHTIGRGGMGAVYLAYDPRFDRDVAIKVLPRELIADPTFRRRFDREARSLAQLEHSAIVPVYDYGEEAGSLYIVMRYMSGGSLIDQIRSGDYSLSDVIHVLDRIASALDSAHRRGIIHRDVKPNNILYDQYGESYLADFGIVRIAESSDIDTTTSSLSTGVMGTPAYMAPEMAQPGGLTPAIDIYALGATLFQMLTGKLPYQADTPIGMMMAHVTSPIPQISKYRPDLPSEVQQVIDMSLNKDPLQRYANASQMVGDFRLALSGEQPAYTSPVTMPMAPLDLLAHDDETQRRRRTGGWLLPVFAFVSVILLLGLGWMLYALGTFDSFLGVTPESPPVTEITEETGTTPSPEPSLEPSPNPADLLALFFEAVEGDVLAGALGQGSFALMSGGSNLLPPGEVRVQPDGRTAVSIPGLLLIVFESNTDFYYLPGDRADAPCIELQKGIGYFMNPSRGMFEEDRPCEVHTPNGVIVLLDSSPSVAYQPDTGTTIITCIDGPCTILFEGETYILLAGEAIELPSDDPQSRILDDEEVTGWIDTFSYLDKEGLRVEFDETTITDPYGRQP